MSVTETDQVEFSEHELLESEPFVEPLIANGVRCHGGFDSDGNYVSPRTKHRAPAIAAWQAQHRAQFGTDLLDLPLDTWPAMYPNVDQARFLVTKGVPGPIITELTRIGTVEGFGSTIRNSVLPDWSTTFVEDVRGTAIAHLDRGLYEAHARDEAGFDGEAGHQQMWFAVRDIAFEDPISEDATITMLERLGVSIPGSGGAIDFDRLRAQALANRLLPDDIDFEFESLLASMIRLVLIEISAFHIFAWAETLLGDTDLVAGDGEAARLVAAIRSDETPHVDYLRTTLSEMRDRTVIGRSGRHYPGTDVIGPLWDRALAQSIGVGRQARVETAWREINHAVEGRSDSADLLAEFTSLGTVHRGDDGTWTDTSA